MKHLSVRSFTTDDLVMLPRLDAGSAAALGTALLSAAKAERKLATGIREASRDLKRAHVALMRAARARVGKAKKEEDKKKEHRAVNAVWSATYKWLDGWARLSPEGASPKSAEARRLMDVLFADGLELLQLQYERGWAEAEQRLAALAEEEMEDGFTTLGGAEFLREVRRSHKRFGEVLGLTKARGARKTLPSIREPLDRFLTSMRSYVVQVVAGAEAEVADRLLAPLVEWKSSTRGRERTVEPEAAGPVVSPPSVPPPAAPPATEVE